MKLIYTLFLVALVGCTEADKPKELTWVTDQCARREIFQQCLKLLPAGPVQAKYNDWDEVVEACSDVAYWQSRIQDASAVKKECRA